MNESTGQVNIHLLRWLLLNAIKFESFFISVEILCSPAMEENLGPLDAFGLVLDSTPRHPLCEFSLVLIVQQIE